MLTVLRGPDFRLVFFGLVASILGDSVVLLVPGILMRDLTGSNGAAGLTIFFFTLPICFAPAVGWLIDRVRRRPFLIAANAVSAVLLLPLLAVRDGGDWWLVYGLVAAPGRLGPVVAGVATGYDAVGAIPLLLSMAAERPRSRCSTSGCCFL
jgi:MFS family permease